MSSEEGRVLSTFVARLRRMDDDEDTYAELRGAPAILGFEPGQEIQIKGHSKYNGRYRIEKIAPSDPARMELVEVDEAPEDK